MRNVEANVVDAVYLHLLVDGARHDVARSQRETLVVLLHERLAVRQAQYAAVATHRLSDEERGVSLARMVERRGVELHELHVLHRALGTIYHRLAVARSDDGVGCGLVDGAAAARAHQRHLTEIRVHLLRLWVQHVRTVAVDIRCAACDARSEVVLRDYLHGEVVLLNVDVGACTHSRHQSALNLGARVVGMVQDAELGVSALAMQVELAVLLAVEVDAPLHELGNLLRRIAHHLLYGTAVADEVARYHRVFYMLVEIVDCKISH